jgi:hypothetical protein
MLTIRPASLIGHTRTHTYVNFGLRVDLLFPCLNVPFGLSDGANVLIFSIQSAFRLHSLTDRRSIKRTPSFLEYLVRCS